MNMCPGVWVMRRERGPAVDEVASILGKESGLHRQPPASTAPEPTKWPSSRKWA
jgi:hypothetical protein